MKPTLNIVMIGIAAGVAAAILSIGSVVQNVLAYALLLLSPMPILLAGLGCGPVATITAVIACGVSIAAVAGVTQALVVLSSTVLPVAIASYFLGMARSDENSREWFSLGSVLFIVSLAVATGFVVIGYATGYSPALLDSVSPDFVRIIEALNPNLKSKPEEAKILIEFYKASFPFFLPGSWLLIVIGNTWLALAIARKSGLFLRPKDNWPNELHLPVEAMVLLSLAVIGAVFSNALGTALLAYAGALAMAFVMTGFAFVHAKSRNKPWRGAALCASYVATLSFGAAPIFLIVGLYRSITHSAPIGSTP